MRKIQKETLETVLEEFQGYECLKDSIQELVDPEMGLISGFQDMINAVTGLKSSDLEKYTPF